jgi:hypothetical protein
VSSPGRSDNARIDHLTLVDPACRELTPHRREHIGQPAAVIDTQETDRAHLGATFGPVNRDHVAARRRRVVVDCGRLDVTNDCVRVEQHALLAVGFAHDKLGQRGIGIESTREDAVARPAARPHTTTPARVVLFEHGAKRLASWQCHDLIARRACSSPAPKRATPQRSMSLPSSGTDPLIGVPNTVLAEGHRSRRARRILEHAHLWRWGRRCRIRASRFSPEWRSHPTLRSRAQPVGIEA